jgi:DNA-binding protein
MASEANVVLIGKKPTMSYVLAVITHFNMSNANEVILKARGRAITTAVDVAEIVKRKFINSLKVEKIHIGTEDVQQQEGGTRPVSTMEITLRK